MKRVVLLIFVGLSGCAGNDNNTVYLCNGPQSKVYHRTSHCQGLKRCSTDIESVDISAATERHRRECRYCY